MGVGCMVSRWRARLPCAAEHASGYAHRELWVVVKYILSVKRSAPFSTPSSLSPVHRQVDSCMDCASCESGNEQYCGSGATLTYASPAKYGRACPDGEETKGGYSKVCTTGIRSWLSSHVGFGTTRYYHLGRVAPATTTA